MFCGKTKGKRGGHMENLAKRIRMGIGNFVWERKENRRIKKEAKQILKSKGWGLLGTMKGVTKAIPEFYTGVGLLALAGYGLVGAGIIWDFVTGGNIDAQYINETIEGVVAIAGALGLLAVFPTAFYGIPEYRENLRDKIEYIEENENRAK